MMLRLFSIGTLVLLVVVAFVLIHPRSVMKEPVNSMELPAVPGPVWHIERAYDFTGDHLKEIIISRQWQGSAALLDYYVIGITPQKIGVLFARSDVYQGSVKAASGRIYEEEPIWAPNEPNCCHRHHLLRIFRWERDHFFLERELIIPGKYANLPLPEVQ